MIQEDSPCNHCQAFVPRDILDLAEHGTEGRPGRGRHRNVRRQREKKGDEVDLDGRRLRRIPTPDGEGILEAAAGDGQPHRRYHAKTLTESETNDRFLIPLRTLKAYGRSSRTRGARGSARGPGTSRSGSPPTGMS